MSNETIIALKERIAFLEEENKHVLAHSGLLPVPDPFENMHDGKMDEDLLRLIRESPRDEMNVEFCPLELLVAFGCTRPTVLMTDESMRSAWIAAEDDRKDYKKGIDSPPINTTGLCQLVTVQK